jgi:uncharacterized membrane protein
VIVGGAATEPTGDDMDVTTDLLEPLDATERRKILGLPIGPKQPDWSRIARLGAATAIVLAAAVAASKLRGRLGALLGTVTDSAEDLVAEVGERARTTADQLGDTVDETVDEVTDAVGGISDTVGGLAGDRGADVADALRSIGGDGDASLLARARSLVAGLISRDDGDDADDVDLKRRLIIRREIDVAVPRRVAYNQWTQLEDLPRIFHGVESVERRDDEHSHWVARVAFLRREWDATITEMVPDERIAWETDDGVEHRGVVTFHRLDDNLTRVQLEMEYHPHSLAERLANRLRLDARRAARDLDLFKHFLELRGEETGAWREEIPKAAAQEGGGSDDDAGSSEHGDTAAEERSASEERTEDAGDEVGDRGDDDAGAPPRDDEGRFVSSEDR